LIEENFNAGFEYTASDDRRTGCRGIGCGGSDGDAAIHSHLARRIERRSDGRFPATVFFSIRTS
jgi:hypothetical protein